MHAPSIATHAPTPPCRFSVTPGRAYLLDRRFLDPRRPIIAPGAKPTPAQAAEGLPPYAPELPLAGQQYATLDSQVGGRGVGVLVGRQRLGADCCPATAAGELLRLPGLRAHSPARLPTLVLRPLPTPPPARWRACAAARWRRLCWSPRS